MNHSNRPVVLLAFADPRRDLDHLKQESNRLQDLFWPKEDFVEVKVLDHPSLEHIVSTFQRYRNRIVAFHYGGHASGLELLLETRQGEIQHTTAAGLAEFLSHQTGLHFIFLNGCSTQRQAQGFIDAGVRCVIATDRAINDRVASEFATCFYGALVHGADLKTAFGEASAATCSGNGGNMRALYADATDDEQSTDLEPTPPWNQYAADDDALEWSFEFESRRRRRAVKGRDERETIDKKALLSLLDKVKKYWVDGQLQTDERSLLRLSMVYRSDAVENPWLDTRTGASSAVDQQVDGRITDAFDVAGQSLLILGQPGSGKTTALLELTQELVRRAERESEQPIPALLHLSTWNDSFSTLQDWVHAELSSKYLIPRSISKSWLADQKLILLFDGMDEMSESERPRCARAINSFLTQTSAPGMVVCSRAEEYFAIDVQLRLSAAVCLQPLNRDQVFASLAGQNSHDQMLSTLLRQHPDLLTLAQSPLMFDIMRQAFSGQDFTGPETAAQPVPGVDSYNSLERCTEQVFDLYIDKMFSDRLRTTDPLDRPQMDQTLHRMSILMMNQRSAIFMAEDLQPSALETTSQRAAYRIAVAVSYGLISGLIVTLFFSAVSTISRDTGAAMASGLIGWITPIFVAFFIAMAWVDPRLPVLGTGTHSFGAVVRVGMGKFAASMGIWLLVILPVLMMIWASQPPHLRPTDAQRAAAVLLLLAGGLASILLAGFGVNRNVFDKIRSVEALRFSFRSAGRGMLWGGAAGLLLWIIHTLGWPKPNLHFWYQSVESSPQAIEATSQGGAIYFIALVAIGLQSGAIVGGWVPTVIERKTRFNEGMWLSRRNAMIAGMTCAVAVTLTMFAMIIVIRQRTLAADYPFALATGLLTFFCAASWFGGFEWLKHLVLRIVLAITGRLPIRLPRFLLLADRLRFMHRVGGGYMFLHRMLLEHFARRHQH